MIETRRCAGSANPSAVSMSDATQILSAIEQGDPSAAEQLLPLVFFAGLTVEELAPLIAFSPRSARRLWVFARA
jgi:hypothetical protein